MNTWLKSILALFIGGFAGALADLLTSVLSSENFNFDLVSLQRMALVALLTGAVAVLGYLKQSPLPKE